VSVVKDLFDETIQATHFLMNEPVMFDSSIHVGAINWLA